MTASLVCERVCVCDHGLAEDRIGLRVALARVFLRQVSGTRHTHLCVLKTGSFENNVLLNLSIVNDDYRKDDFLFNQL